LLVWGSLSVGNFVAGTIDWVLEWRHVFSSLLFSFKLLFPANLSVHLEKKNSEIVAEEAGLLRAYSLAWQPKHPQAQVAGSLRDPAGV